MVAVKLRLAHRILAQAKAPGFVFNEPYDTEKHQKVCFAQVKALAHRECPIIIGDSIMDYIVRNRDKDTYFQVRPERDLACVAPPFPMFFIESWYTVPDCPQRGWFCEVIPREEAAENGILKVAITEWILSMTAWVGLKDGSVGFPGDSVTVAITKEGKICGQGYTPGRLHDTGDTPPPELLENQFNAYACMTTFGQALMVINFMNLKNSVMVDVTETKGPGKKWLRRQKKPALEYRQVTIDPNKTLKRSKSKDTRNVTSNPVSFHIRRGHIIVYSKENGGKGMFGKGIYGAFWKEACAVGDKKNGQAKTIYNVKAPR